MNSPSSIRQAFKSQLLYFGVMPLAFVIFLVFMIFVREGIEQTKRTSLWQAKSYAIEMRQILGNIAHQIQGDSELPAIQSSLLGPGQSGALIRFLQQKVNASDILDGALVVKEENQLLEAFPFAWYSSPSEVWENIQIKINTDNMDSIPEPQFHYIDFSALNVQSEKFLAKTSEGPFLTLSAPLVVEQNSFVRPHRHVGYLVYLVSLKKLMAKTIEAGRINDELGEVVLKLEDVELLRTADEGGGVTYSSLSEVSLPIKYRAEEPKIIVEQFSYLNTHLLSAMLTMLLLLLMLAFVVVVLVIYSRRLKLKMDEPLHAIVADCEKVCVGDIKLPRRQFAFTEYQTIHSAIVRMAETIERQVQAIVEQKRKAERSELVKSQFLANMSHEIRTPINGIIGMLTLVQKTQLTSEQQRKILLANKSAHSLVGLINDILDFSKIEAEKMELEIVDFNLLDMLETIVEIMEVKAAEKGVSLFLDAHNLKRVAVKGDEGRIRQVITNVVGNALKFTEKGGVRVVANYYPDRDGSGLFSCEVRDTGIGMNQEQLGNIFQNFVQADNSTTRKFGGTGLGLAISKKLAELMSGTITVKSELGKGSQFHIEIPLLVCESEVANTPIDDAAEDAYNGYVTRSSTRRHKILLVEDNDINQEVVKGILEEVDLEVEVAGDGLQALSLLKQNDSYSLVLMDCQMPTLDGYQTTQAIRSGSAGDHYIKVAIIALTANAYEKDREKCLACGMDDYLSKPLDEKLLLSKIFSFIERRHEVSASQGDSVAAALSAAERKTKNVRDIAQTLEDEVGQDVNKEKTTEIDSGGKTVGLDPSQADIYKRTEATESPADDPQQCVWDREAALGRMRGRADRLHKLLTMFLEGTPERMRTLGYAVDNQNYSDVRSTSHAIKGVAGNLSANVLYQCAASLEQLIKDEQFSKVADQYQALVEANTQVTEAFSAELEKPPSETDS